jgi:hypothetical protein
MFKNLSSSKVVDLIVFFWSISIILKGIWNIKFHLALLMNIAPNKVMVEWTDASQISQFSDYSSCFVLKTFLCQIWFMDQLPRKRFYMLSGCPGFLSAKLSS